MPSYLAKCISHWSMEKVKRQQPWRIAVHGWLSPGLPRLVIFCFDEISREWEFHLLITVFLFLSAKVHGVPWQTLAGWAAGWPMLVVVDYPHCLHHREDENSLVQYSIFPITRQRLANYADKICRHLVFYVLVYAEYWTDCSQCVWPSMCMCMMMPKDTFSFWMDN